jgi:tetratricopeptide (TPR) repeat protein
VIVDMKDFPAADQASAQLCIDRVRGCQVYVGVLGTRYGSPVRDRPAVSYTELEFDTASEAGLDRLVFLLDTDADDVSIPPAALIDREFGARQDAFRRRVQASGLVTGLFANPAALGQLVERSLRELAGKHRRIVTGIEPEQVPAIVLVGEIPQEPPGYQPRADLLAQLDEPRPASRPLVVHALTGMPGAGKTHLAAAYARARLADRWRLVAWINAEDTAVMLAGLADAAEALGLGPGAGDVEAAGRAVRHRLEVDGDRCLVVFDNATDPEALVPFVPAAGAARLIITSNQHSVSHLGAGVPVEVFTDQEALTFLAARTGNPDAAGARALAEELGCLPLALAQAAAVIASQHLAYGTYLARLRSLPVGDLLPPVTAGRYPHGAAAAIVLSLGSVRADDRAGACSAVMDLLAVLAPAGVPRLLVQAAGGQGLLGNAGESGELTDEVVDRALAKLAGASLLVFSGDGTTISAHRLVLRVIGDQLAKAGNLAAVCESAAQLLDVQAETVGRTWHEDRPTVRNLVEQIMALYESTARCREVDSGLVSRMIRLRSWVVLFLNQLGDSAAQSISIGEPLLADMERILGADHPETLDLRNYLANAYRGAGRYAEAITLHQENLPARERVLGPDHPDTLRSRNNLGEACHDAGHIAEAITLYEQTLGDRERVIGVDHPDTLTSRSNLASAYRVAGRYAEAIALHERTLGDREQVLGADHPKILESRHCLANAYQDAGRTADAITLHEQNLADQERVLGADHPDTSLLRSNLALAYQAAGRTAEAITLHEQALAARERVLGPGHPHTLLSRSDLAAAHQTAGHTAEAISPDRPDSYANANRPRLPFDP